MFRRNGSPASVSPAGDTHLSERRATLFPAQLPPRGRIFPSTRHPSAGLTRSPPGQCILTVELDASGLAPVGMGTPGMLSACPCGRTRGRRGTPSAGRGQRARRTRGRPESPVFRLGNDEPRKQCPPPTGINLCKTSRAQKRPASLRIAPPWQ